MASPRSWNRAGAKKIAKAVMDQALTGQLEPTKYLFERAEIYPQATDGSPRIVDEESLAVVAPIGYFRGADHGGRGRTQTVASVEKSIAKPADEDDEQDAVAEPKAGKED